ncbi:MAG: trimethylamine methyltransferase family protein [Bilophila wadsworthia]
MRDHGCREDADGCTHFPRTLVKARWKRSSPSSSIAAGRPTTTSHMAQDQCMPPTSAKRIFTHDLETGERRSTVKQDAVDILRVVDSLDNIHIYNRAIGPQDVPSESASMHNAEVAFCYTSKPMHLVSGSPFQTKKMIKMAEIAAGGKEELKTPPHRLQPPPRSARPHLA